MWYVLVNEDDAVVLSTSCVFNTGEDFIIKDGYKLYRLDKEPEFDCCLEDGVLKLSETSGQCVTEIVIN